MTDTLFSLAAAAPPLGVAAPLAAFSLSGLFAKLLSLLWVALGLGLVIFFHELGHFAVAKWCGVRVERFSIGFGPVLFSKTRGETEYALSAFPLGGYVKMLGQDDIDPSQLTSDEIAEDPRSYSAKPVWQRMAIISAGVTMNLITAVVFFAVALWLGMQAPSAVVGQVTTGGPAWTAGVEPGDILRNVGGRKVITFNDVALATALSWGDTLPLRGYRADGTRFELELDPDDSGTRRTAGFAPSLGLTLGTLSAESKSAVHPTSPAAAVADRVRPGDELIAARVLPAPAPPADGDAEEGEDGAAEPAATEAVPLTSFINYSAVVGAAADRPIEFTLRRPDADDPDATGETFSVTVGPTPVRSLGLRVSPQPIAAIRAGSPAEAAGLRVGDELSKVDGRDVGLDLDPLRLPNAFFERAGEAVPVEVVRTGEDGGPSVVKLTITPDARPGWISRPSAPTEPLDVPALGAAFHLNPVITEVTPGGPADRAGLKANDKIVAATFTAPKPAAGEEGREAIKIPFENEKVEDWNPFAYVFTLAQELPEDTLTLTVKRDGTQQTVTLTPAPADDWYFPTRGFLLPRELIERRSDSAADALRDGLRETRTVVEQMYLTLGSLLTGRLSIKNLRGPPGIISEGMRIADNGPADFLHFLGFLSVNLAVLNFLPIPVLDGGHMVWLMWEAVTRKKPSEGLVIGAAYVGLGMIVLLMLTVIYLDIFEHNVFGWG
ncbi:site-2 protease family protein [Alienimonas californiensis]|uniref:Metalloprotease MmpA n=1 Tax=Alienimonas californiensis TaxID=2527989 RepID=A0A517P3V6_9PLAN|nr:site-2 protease family protein [Alienimonas californiensis]QDT14052.1 Metalloprotease MmpA [Alienimonas californiensis]